MKKYLVIIIVLLALILRIGFTLYNFYYHNTDYHAGDGFEYDSTALNLLNKKGWISPDLGGSLYSAQPLYPIFLAGIYGIFGHNFLIVGLIQALLSAFTCLLCYNVARRLFSDTPATVALVIMAVYPYFIFHTDRIGTETISAFLVSLMAYAAVEFSHRRSIGFVVLIGLSSGLAALNRPELYLAPLFLVIWLIFLIKGKIKAILYFLMALSMFILLVAPWHIYQSHNSHKNVVIYPSGASARTLFIHTDLRMAPFFEHKKTYMEQWAEIDRDFLEITKGLAQRDVYNVIISKRLEQIRKHPSEYFRFIVLKWRAFWSIFPYGHRYAKGIFKIGIGFINIVIMSLAIVGILLSFKDIRRTGILISLIAIFIIPHLIAVSDPRYRISIMPYVIIFAGFALYKIAKAIGYPQIKERTDL